MTLQKFLKKTGHGNSLTKLRATVISVSYVYVSSDQNEEAGKQGADQSADS